MGFLQRLSVQVPLRLWQRHRGVFFRYASPRKYLNAAGALYHYVRCTEVIPTRPLFLKVEISRHCTVNCLYCTIKKEERYYPFEKFMTLVDAVRDEAFMVQLYEIGEPFHHERVIDCIRYAHDSRLATVISSSLSLPKPESFWQELATSGLDRMIVAIDGISEPVYRRYRRNGDFWLVMENLGKLLDARRAARSGMSVEWQMVDLPWNRCEQQDARKQALEMGCDVFRVIPEGVLPRLKSGEARVVRTRNCLWPYVVLLVNAYDDVVPCFKPMCYPGVVGNLGDSGLMDVWNGDSIRSIRNPRKISCRQGCMYCTE